MDRIARIILYFYQPNFYTNLGGAQDREAPRTHPAKKLFWLALVALLAVLGYRSADLFSPKSIEPLLVHASYKYAIAGEDLAGAKKAAVLEAKRKCLEKAGTYIEGYTEVLNGQTVRDITRSYTAGFVTTDTAEENLEPDGRNLALIMTVKAEVDPRAIQNRTGQPSGLLAFARNCLGSNDSPARQCPIPARPTAGPLAMSAKLYGPPDKTIKLTGSDWQVILPDPKPGDMIFYLSNHSFRVRDDSAEASWKEAVQNRQAFRYREQDVKGALAFARGAQDTTVYLWFESRL